LRRRKMGFGIPIDQWFRSDLKELAYDVLLSRSARERGLLRPDYVQGLLDQHVAGAQNHHTRLWALLMLELWFRMWIDGSPESEMLRPAA
jgi:asparagine synthase (glutamine-hydrolysing)